MELVQKINNMYEKVDYNKEKQPKFLDFHLQKLKEIMEKYKESKDLNIVISMLKEEANQYEIDLDSLLKEYMDEFVPYEVYLQEVDKNPSLNVIEGYEGINYIYQNEDREYSVVTPELLEIQVNKFLNDISNDYQIDFMESPIQKQYDIQDFGEKIGGAKKDLYTNNRELRPDVLGKLNDAEKMTIIKKDNIWRKSNYQELVDNGENRTIVYFKKVMRDAAPVKPRISPNDPQKDEKLKTYIDFMSDLRDSVNKVSSAEEINNFYKDFLLGKGYVEKTGGYYLHVPELYTDFIDNKLIKAAQEGYSSLYREAERKKFCFSEERLILDMFRIEEFSPEKIQYEKDYRDRDVVKYSPSFGSTYFYYPDEKTLERFKNLKEGEFFVLPASGKSVILADGLESREKAVEFALEYGKKAREAFKEAEKSDSNRKKRFTPKQLELIDRVGHDFVGEKDITGQDYLDTFSFKGGEFGNWLNDKDRQANLNYAYNALMDLSTALEIDPKDVSLDNRLSIAFGARGSGSALAHYEPLREVINLTKMKGAGSLAHEWGHALDDIIGKQTGLNGFVSEHTYKNAELKSFNKLVNSMKQKEIIINEYFSKEDIDKDKLVVRYSKDADRYKSHFMSEINAYLPDEKLTPEQITKKNELIEKAFEKGTSVTIEKHKMVKVSDEVSELSQMRKEVSGRVINASARESLMSMMDWARRSEDSKNNRIKELNEASGQDRVVKVPTDFYTNSQRFDTLYAKDSKGYWASDVELFARAFACYVKDKLDEKGIKSDYLCAHSDLAIGFDTKEDGSLTIIKAYPEGEERKALNKLFDELINELKEKDLLHQMDKDVIELSLDFVRREEPEIKETPSQEKEEELKLPFPEVEEPLPADVESFIEEQEEKSKEEPKATEKNSSQKSKKSFNKDEYKNEKQQKIKESFDKIGENAKNVFQKDSYKKYLEFCSKFNRYSTNNQLLINAQNPNATLVNSFNKWKEFGRHVKKGEKGLTILAPSSYKRKVEEFIRDEDGNVVKDSKGLAKTQEVEQIVNTFTLVNVFDVSQTEGAPIPEIVNPLRGTSIEAVSIIDTVKDVSKIPVEYAEPGDSSIAGGAKGYCTKEKIVLDGSLDENQIAKTAIHEFAHDYLNHIEDSTKTKAQAEIEAESIAYVVCNHFGLDTSNYSFDYVGIYAADKTPEELKEVLSNIKEASSKIIEEMEPEFYKNIEYNLRENIYDEILDFMSTYDTYEFKDNFEGMERSEIIANSGLDLTTQYGINQAIKMIEEIDVEYDADLSNRKENLIEKCNHLIDYDKKYEELVKEKSKERNKDKSNDKEQTKKPKKSKTKSSYDERG